MRKADTGLQERDHGGESTDYTRFIILSLGRTGTNMLSQALNSSPRIVCFGDVFNPQADLVQLFVGTYERFTDRELSLRSRDPLRFLEERILCPYPGEVRAVGFKLHYGQLPGYPGLLERLASDKELRVLHLRRRNLLRTLVSLKRARATGVYLDDSKRKLTLARLMNVARHPLRTARTLRRRLSPARASQQAARARVTVSADELRDFIVGTRMRAASHDRLYDAHPKLTVWYEDIVDRWEETLAEVQSFLGVEPAPLTVTLRRQNPEPLRELVENYDELYEAFEGTQHQGFFD